MELCQIYFGNQYCRTHPSCWNMVCRIFGLITVQTSFCMVFCTNNELLGRTDGLLSFVLNLYLLLFFSSFLISFILSFMFHRFYFLCFIWCCIILFVILYCLFHFFLIFLFFLHSYFLVIYFLILLIYFPVSSFLYLFNLVSVSQSLSFEIRLPESIRVLEACKVSGCRSFWILRLSLFPRMHAWSMIDGLLNLWTLHECGDAPT